MGVAHNHVEKVGRECQVAAAAWNCKAERIAPNAILLNPRNSSQRCWSHRGDHLRIAPTDNLGGNTTQLSDAAALRGPEAATKNCDRSSSASRSRAYERYLRCS